MLFIGFLPQSFVRAWSKLGVKHPPRARYMLEGVDVVILALWKKLKYPEGTAYFELVLFIWRKTNNWPNTWNLWVTIIDQMRIRTWYSSNNMGHIIRHLACIWMNVKQFGQASAQSCQNLTILFTLLRTVWTYRKEPDLKTCWVTVMTVYACFEVYWKDISHGLALVIR